MKEPIGIYLHIPFCRRKCAYCDFFSGTGDEAAFDRYTDTLEARIRYWGNAAAEPVASIYFGGGTPSILGTERLCRLLNAVQTSFDVCADAEITFEANPESGKALDFEKLRAQGFNRLSVGLQTAVSREITTLGRIHTPDEAALTVSRARQAGFDNISLDLMMGIPDQTVASLRQSIDFCIGCGVRHISSYLLKIEEGTRFYSIKEQLNLPDEDEQARLYLFAADYLEKNGFPQYEISNFAQKGYESRHNTLYWRCGEYIGIGPAAYSFYRGKRFHYGRSLSDFAENRIVEDGDGGDCEEYVMLALRLRAGLVFEDYERRYGRELSPALLKKLGQFQRAGFLELDRRHVSLTPKGFLVSNSLLAEILDLL